MKVTCEVHIDPYDFVRSSDYETMLFFIQAVDAFVADVGFTEDLVKMLVQSLKADKEDVNLPFIDWEAV